MEPNSQFVDNASVSLNASSPQHIVNLVELLNKFKLASRLEIN